MKFLPSTEQDIKQLSEWIQTDPYHKDCLDPFWWLTGNGFLSFCAQDDKGPTMYVRIDKENGLMRLHCQFGPETEVSKKRVIKTFTWGLPQMQPLGIVNGMIGFIFKSKSLLLIQYMERQFGFQAVGNDDYKLLWSLPSSREAEGRVAICVDHHHKKKGLPEHNQIYLQ
jgi:hypothetical protein